MVVVVKYDFLTLNYLTFLNDVLLKVPNENDVEGVVVVIVGAVKFVVVVATGEVVKFVAVVASLN